MLLMTSKQAFCFIDIGVHHHESSSELAASGVRKIKLEPAEASVASERKVEKAQPTPKGPFECTMAGCDYLTDSVVHFGKHWKVKHPVDPSKAVFKDQATGLMLDIFMIFNFIMQCKLCRVVRMARDNLNHATQGVKAHIEEYHQAERDNAGGNLTVLFRVLKDSDGKRDEKDLDQHSVSCQNEQAPGEEKDIGDYKLVPFTILQERGFPDRFVSHAKFCCSITRTVSSGRLRNQNVLSSAASAKSVSV